MDKDAMYFMIGATVALFILFACTYLFKTNLWYHRKAAGKGWNIIGAVLLIAGLAGAWYVAYEDMGWGYGVAGLALAGLHPVFACGWDFSDIHLPPEKR